MDEVTSMAGDWIKMRPALLTSPKVNGIARFLEKDQRLGRRLLNVATGVMSDVVTRDVMRFVTVATLLKVWGAANEHTDDGVFKNADLQDIDDIAGIPGFGEAMQAEGWAFYDAEERTVELPNFNEYNTAAGARGGKTPAQRQKEYRERKEAERVNLLRSALHNSDDNALHNSDAEKRREEKSNKDPEKSSVQKSEKADKELFLPFWKLYPSSKGKAEAEKAWTKLRASDVPKVMESLAKHIGCRDWVKDDGQYIPMASTWLNKRRFEDEVKPYVAGTNSGTAGQSRPSLVERVRQANAHLFNEPPPQIDERDWSEFDSIREIDGQVVDPDDGDVWP